MAIQAEIYAYLQELGRVLPYHEIAKNLPAGTELPELPSVPDIIAWLERFEEWGMPHKGTWMDQPKWFMEDIRAAKHGRDGYTHEQERALLNEQEVNRATRPGLPQMDITGLLDAAEALTG